MKKGRLISLGCLSLALGLAPGCGRSRSQGRRGAGNMKKRGGALLGRGSEHGVAGVYGFGVIHRRLS